MNEKMTVIAIFLALLPALDLFVRIIFGKNNNFFPFSKKLLQHDTNKKPLDLTFYFIALNFFRLFVIFIISMAIVSYLDTISGTLVFELLSVEYFVILTVS